MAWWQVGVVLNLEVGEAEAEEVPVRPGIASFAVFYMMLPKVNLSCESMFHYTNFFANTFANCDALFACSGTTTAPVSKLSHNVGVASLAWLAEGKTLCVGSQVRNFHLYDLRISGTTPSPISTWAHTEAVNGIEADPQRPEIFATFGRTPSEPVKLWDCRRMDSPVGEIKTYGVLSAIQWSLVCPGMLSVAVGDMVQLYDTTASLSRPVLMRINHTESQVLDLALYPRPHNTASKQQPKEILSSDQLLVSELCQNRMLVVLGGRIVQNVPKHTAAPLAISRRDGRIAHAFCGALWVRSSSDGTSCVSSRLPVLLQTLKYSMVQVPLLWKVPQFTTPRTFPLE